MTWLVYCPEICVRNAITKNVLITKKNTAADTIVGHAFELYPYTLLHTTKNFRDNSIVFFSLNNFTTLWYGIIGFNGNCDCQPAIKCQARLASMTDQKHNNYSVHASKSKADMFVCTAQSSIGDGNESAHNVRHSGFFTWLLINAGRIIYAVYFSWMYFKL